jgi:hypothetical protein
VAGVKGAEPLVALRREQNSPKSCKSAFVKIKANKVKNPKAQFAQIRENSYRLVTNRL